MNKTRTWMLLVLSVLLALTAVSLAARWLHRSDPMGLVPVPVAAQDLPAGTRLQAGHWQMAHWPRTAMADLGPGALPDADIEGRVLASAVVRGEPVLAARLAAPGETGGLSALLSTGRRAVTVKVNEIVGVAGFALPGHHVDVMVHAPDLGGQPVSRIVLERIKVLAIAQDAAVAEHKPRVVNAVTLEVTPKQAEQLDLARSVGTLSLVLRSQGDTAHADTPGARPLDLLPAAPAPAVAPAVAAAPVRSARSTGTRQRPAAAAAAVTPPPAAVPAAPEAAGPTLQIVRGLQLSLE